MEGRASPPGGGGRMRRTTPTRAERRLLLFSGRVVRFLWIGNESEDNAHLTQ
jgi:hypothetical protein